ncbi:MAG TPA: amidohydrolase, partial [Actinomycetes bacterium]|nr:amidohydrolase [Actinomycetes bacterium]
MNSHVSRRTFLAGAGAAGAVVAAPFVSGTAIASNSTAATIIYNGRVFTGRRKDSVQSAVAIDAAGQIIATGTWASVVRHKGRSTQLIDAQGGTVMAGLQDGHCHPMYAGLRSLSPSLDDAVLTVPQLQDILTSLLQASIDKEPDGWLVVESWNPVGLLPDGTVADKKYLDTLATSRPIALRGSDGHNTWVNSRALQIAGVDSNTPDPVGGIIVRDGGEPTGLLKDSAQDLVTQFIPGPTWDEMLNSFEWAFDQLAAGGVTSLLDAWVEPWQLGAYAELSAADRFPQRITPALLISAGRAADPQAALEWAQRKAKHYAGIPRLNFGSVKIFMDGVIEYPAQTAALLKPYLVDGQPGDNYGELYVDGTTLGAMTTAFDGAGWQVHAHAIGDAAVRAALDGYEIAINHNGQRGNRHTIAHLQLVHPHDYPRFAKLDVIPDMQLQWATRNVWTMEALLPYIGPERHARMYPARSLLDAGAALAGGSDWPVDPLYPWNQVQSAIDRFGLYGEGSPLNPDQGISRVQSLRMHSSGTAY